MHQKNEEAHQKNEEALQRNEALLERNQVLLEKSQILIVNVIESVDTLARIAHSHENRITNLEDGLQ